MKFKMSSPPKSRGGSNKLSALFFNWIPACLPAGMAFARLAEASAKWAGMTTMALLFTSPVYAQVDIGREYGYGYIKSLGEGVTLLVTPTFSIATALVVIYFIVGAFKYLTAAGNKEATAAGRSMITHAIIGFIILMFAFIILQFLLGNLFNIDFRIIRT